MEKGLIALDIDGTLTADLHSIPREVTAYIRELTEKGWQIAVITGRPFSFAYSILQDWEFPYYCAVQNGADILKMPGESSLGRFHLGHEVLDVLERAYEEEEEDFLLYAGYEKGDFCYYRPERFSPKMRPYLEKLQTLSPIPWKAVEDFTPELIESFALVKCFGPKEKMERIQALLQDQAGIHVNLIRDPLSTEFLTLITDARATKGRALDYILQKQKKEGKVVIAAGDDGNDLSMLERADMRIVMETAPEALLTLADVIAPSSARLGIITGLQKALTHSKLQPLLSTWNP